MLRPLSAALVPVSFLLVSLNGAMADRCSDLIDQYNRIDDQYERLVNRWESLYPRGKQCSEGYASMVEQMLNNIRQKITVRQQLDAGCQNQMTGGNTVMELRKIIADVSASMKTTRDECAAAKDPVDCGVLVSKATEHGSECLKFENKCTYEVSVFYVENPGGAGQMPVRRLGKYCAAPGRTLRYLRFERRAQ